MFRQLEIRGKLEPEMRELHNFAVLNVSRDGTACAP